MLLILLPKGDQVLGIRLGIMVRDVQGRIGHMVDRGIEQGMTGRVADIRCQNILLPETVFADAHTAGENVLNTRPVRDTVRATGRIGRVAGKVDSLAIRRGVLPGKTPIKTLFIYSRAQSVVSNTFRASSISIFPVPTWFIILLTTSALVPCHNQRRSKRCKAFCCTVTSSSSPVSR
jgi:hypothetical protein